MSSRSAILASLIYVALFVAPSAAHAWPDRNVRLITPAAAGSHTDVIARLLADGLAKKWRQPVIVENQPGADGILAVRSFVGSNDGHTLLYSFNSIVTANPVLHASLPYDPAKDLAPLARVVEDFICIVAAPQSGIATLSDLERAAQKNGRDLTYTSFPGSPYIVFQIFQKKIGAEMTFVPYRAIPAALNDLMQNRVQVGVLSLALVQELARAQKLKVLAVASKERAPAALDIPTTQEAAHPELLVLGGHGLFARSNMTAELHERVSRDALELLAEPQIQDRIAQLGFALRAERPAEFRAFLESETKRIQALARELGEKVHAPNGP